MNSAPSSLTQVVSTRVPNRDAEHLRQLADSYGVTVSDVLKAALNASLPVVAHAAPLQTDAQERVKNLRATARRLFQDRDDSMVMSELLSVLGQLRAAEAELGVTRHG
jgi:phage-related baseplate assembly protein